MQVHTDGAQRASSKRPTRIAMFLIFAVAVAFGGLAAHPSTTEAASSVKVVIVVGPVGTPLAEGSVMTGAAPGRAPGAPGSRSVWPGCSA